MYSEQGTNMYILHIHHLNNLEKAEHSHKTYTKSRHYVKLFFLVIILKICQLQQKEISTSMFIALNIFKLQVKTY